MTHATKYVALDVHQATTLASVRAETGRVIARRSRRPRRPVSGSRRPRGRRRKSISAPPAGSSIRATDSSKRPGSSS